jgi:hypothetical protein
MRLEKYINQFPPGDQQEIRRLLEQYNSAVNAQDRALAQRRLEPFTRALMQTPDMVGRRNFLDDVARQKYLKNTMGRETSEPIAAKFPAPRTAMDYLIGSGMQSDQIRSLEKMGQAVNPMPPLQSPPAVQSRQIAGPPQQAQGPASPPRDTSPYNYKIPAAQTPPASQVQPVPAQGLLDTEEPAKGGSFYDDPMRMGLLQAGLGLMSGPRYSTNPNDVTLSSGLARGLGGFVQGYGGTKKRLSEAERQRIEDERDARKEEYDIMYLRALTTDAISRAQQTSATMTEKAEARRLSGQLKESQVSQILNKQTDINQTQRVERRKQLMGMSPEMLQSEYHQFFPTAEMQKSQNLREKLATYTGQPAETYAAYESKDLISAISKYEEPKKPETKPRGSQPERDEDILIKATAEQANDPKVQMAFQRLFLEPSDETTQWNPQKQQTERFKTYPTIPDYYVEKFPALAQQQAQLKNQSSVVPAKRNLTEQQQRARGNVLAGFEQEIISNNYDEPMDTFSFDEAMPFRRFQSDEYRMKIDAQDRWIENVLRAASGAAIAQSEYDSYRTQYFPTPGEGPESKERKRQMRALKVQEAQLKIAEQARIQGALPQVSEDPDDILLQ